MEENNYEQAYARIVESRDNSFAVVYPAIVSPYDTYFSVSTTSNTSYVSPNIPVDNNYSIQTPEIGSLKRQMEEMRRELEALKQEKKELENIKIADTEPSRKLAV